MFHVFLLLALIFLLLTFYCFYYFFYYLFLFFSSKNYKIKLYALVYYKDFKEELQQITINHFSSIDLKDFIKIYE